ncbi:MAG TPA: PhzF family phenazine biosynthesis protein [Flavisolibacter sp.]|nr:PhzF family phenazine biosynthesis protein [Flavisolibacter sp.]
MTINVQVINAFSIDGQGGNPAGVVFDADQFSPQTKQAIATAAGFPETAFVSSSTVADFKLDFFTPTKQIPHCGHATIATFSYLKSMGKIKSNRSSKETIDGCRSIFFKDGLAFMEQKAPTFLNPSADFEKILASLNLSSNDLLPELMPMVVNTGNSFLIVPVKNETVLAAIRYNKEMVSQVSEKYGLIGYYVYTHPALQAFDATARMFGPFYGIDEEAATGMAAGPLAAYLYKEEKLLKEHFAIEQGRFMHPASPSRIQVDLTIAGGEITGLFAGGDSYVSGEKKVEIAW